MLGTPLARYVVRRLVGLMAALALVVVATFLMIHLVPGDPARAALGPTAPKTLVDQTREDWGLNESLGSQFADYLSGLRRGDLGVSFTSQEPVADIIGARLPRTAQLAVSSLAVTLLLSLPIGVAAGAWTAHGRRKRLEATFNGGTGLVASIPDYLLALVLAYVFAVATHLLPVAGANDGWRSLVLPTVSIALGPAAILSRLIRAQTLNVLGQDYIRSARGKRLPNRLVFLRHALPNLVTSTMTVGGLLFASLIGGSVIVENVFAWPGLGYQVVHSIQSHDYPVIQGIVLLLATAVIVINATVDLLIAAVDPRSTLGGEA